MISNGVNWVCPSCGAAQVISQERHSIKWQAFYVKTWINGDPGTGTEIIICANEVCRKMTLSLLLVNREDNNTGFRIANAIKEWQLLPASFAKPQPDCVPGPIRADYYEACAIRDLSPKASATLIRRCLQGMIRDFCGISKATLKLEIDELRRQVGAGDAPRDIQPDTVEAIDAVRRIGNIGAHMERDIDLIVDVDPGEVQTLIDLTEMLFSEWYVEREARRERIAAISGIAAAKRAIQEQKKLPPPAELV